MRRPLILAILALFAQSPSLIAEPISGTKSAVWLNPTGGTVTGAGTDWLDFGIDTVGSLGWTGNSYFSTTTGTPFALGAVWLVNGSSIDAPTAATFSVTLDINSPTNETPATFAFDSSLLSEGGALKFSVTPGQTSNWTSSSGTTYSLEMLGLGNNLPWDGTTISELTAGPDDNTNQTYAYIYGRLSADVLTTDDSSCVPQVPEPSAWILAGIGMSLLPMLRRRNAGHQPVA